MHGKRPGLSRTLLDEAANARMHLMTIVGIARPSFERLVVLVAPGVFYDLCFVIYRVSPTTAHRIVGHFEEEAVCSYSENPAGIDRGAFEHVPAPQIAIDDRALPADARLRDVILAVRADEAGHRDVNLAFADRPGGVRARDTLGSRPRPDP